MSDVGIPLAAIGVWESHSEAETEAIGTRLAAVLPPDALVLLTGDLGAGKTVLVRGLARGVGVDAAEVQSPSYALIHEHEGATGGLVHVDLYRLQPVETEGLGLDELLAGPGLKAVEWPERLPTVPPVALDVTIEQRPDGRRRVTAKAQGES